MWIKKEKINIKKPAWLNKPKLVLFIPQLNQNYGLFSGHSGQRNGALEISEDGRVFTKHISE